MTNLYRNSPYALLGVVGLMLATGVVMLSSAGAPDAAQAGSWWSDSHKQCAWVALGLVICLVFAAIDYHVLERWWLAILIASVVLLALCFVPPFGHRLNGSSRWVGLGWARCQPSELAKLAVIVFLAHWYARHEARSGSALVGFLLPLCVVGGVGILIAAEIDLGTTALLIACSVTLMYVAGANPRLLVPLMLFCAAVLLGLVYLMPERFDRLLAFLDLERHKEGAGFQQYQGLIAVGSGGIGGLGLGNGRQKHFYVPFANTDFIFTVIGEELGLAATLLVVVGYIVLLFAGTLMVLHARDRFGALLGFGLLTLMTAQAIMNIGVTTAMLPNKGLPLPLISYGGSNLFLCLATVGVLLSIHRQGLTARRSNAAVVLRARIARR